MRFHVSRRWFRGSDCRISRPLADSARLYDRQWCGQFCGVPFTRYNKCRFPTFPTRRATPIVRFSNIKLRPTVQPRILVPLKLRHPPIPTETTTDQQVVEVPEAGSILIRQDDFSSSAECRFSRTNGPAQPLRPASSNHRWSTHRFL